MKKEPTYHIDVTPEEALLFQDVDKNQSKKYKFSAKGSFAKIFCVVLGLHVAGAALIVFGTSSANASPSAEKVQTLPKESSTIGPASDSISITEPQTLPIDQQPEKPKPTPQPLHQQTEKTEHLSQSQQSIPTPKLTPTSKLVKDYTVKQGDTVNSIAKKYRLVTDRLMKLNNIKDPNKIKVGQTLKFM